MKETLPDMLARLRCSTRAEVYDLARLLAIAEDWQKLIGAGHTWKPWHHPTCSADWPDPLEVAPGVIITSPNATCTCGVVVLRAALDGTA